MGEAFLPMSVATYLAQAAHMRSDGKGRHKVLGASGALSDATLTDEATDGSDARDFLTVAGTTAADDVATMFQRESRQAVGFHSGGGRLARVGYGSRLIDAMFAISLLARGRVPGSLARASVLRYRSLPPEERSTHPYYGRVVRTATWTALQYWFFFAFNDWRSGFNGANDHEADWEQIFVYLDSSPDGTAVPVWAAYAQHDYHGRDLRRRWDDAEQLDLVGNHPVVYAGAGSHASYFRPGEYLAEQPVRLPSIINRVSSALSQVIRGKGEGGDNALSIAFVDFARGDGVSIGPGEEREWSPVVMDDSQPWVRGYSGLWGMSVEDPFEGEDAPAGPMFNRNRSVRMSWSDPISFAELDRRASALDDEGAASREHRGGRAPAVRAAGGDPRARARAVCSRGRSRAHRGTNWNGLRPASPSERGSGRSSPAFSGSARTTSSGSDRPSPTDCRGRSGSAGAATVAPASDPGADTGRSQSRRGGRSRRGPR